MMRIALINSNAGERDALCKALARCAEDLHHPPADIACFGGIAAFHDMLITRNPHHFDVVVCCIDRLRGLTAPTRDGVEASTIGPLDFLARLRRRIPDLPLVVASHDTSSAIGAYHIRAAFIHLPGTYDDLRRVMREPLAHVGWDFAPCLAIRTSGQVSNVPATDIQFAESSKRGPVIHLPKDRLVITRGTLRGLFERLETGWGDKALSHDTLLKSPFVMAGSSFIVNLDNVVASGQGVLVFTDGETIIVPVRKRKDIEQALQSFRTFGPDFI